MYYSNDQALDNMVKGWTRIDMLLNLYERAIFAVDAANVANSVNDNASMLIQTLEAQKLVLGLYSGLKTDECEVANNVARLLSFVMLRIEEKKFDEAKSFLERLHHSFSQIRKQAVELESKGIIPPMADANVLEVMA